MVTFRQFLESLSSRGYTFPKDPVQRIYDFYALEYVASVLGRSEHLARLDQADQYLFRETQDILLNSMQKWLAKEMILSCAGEARYLFTMADFTSNGPTSFLPRDEELQKLWNRIEDETQNFDSRKRVRKFTNDYLKQGGDAKTLMEFLSDLFNEEHYEWDPDYGGTNWQTIADAWAPLVSARTIKEKYIQIDHAIDLTHNGGTSFLEKAYDDDPVLTKELNAALNYKAQIDPYRFPVLSREIREMMYRFVPQERRGDTSIPDRNRDFLRDPSKYTHLVRRIFPMKTERKTRIQLNMFADDYSNPSRVLNHNHDLGIPWEETGFGHSYWTAVSPSNNSMPVIMKVQKGPPVKTNWGAGTFIEFDSRKPMDFLTFFNHLNKLFPPGLSVQSFHDRGTEVEFKMWSGPPPSSPLHI